MQNTTEDCLTVKEISFRSKKGHKDQIVALSRRDEKTFFTFSEDLSARLWDIRTATGIKMFSLNSKLDDFQINEPSGGSVEWIENKHTVVCSTENKVNDLILICINGLDLVF